MSPELRGIFLTSKEPQLTAKFYLDVAELELEQIGNAANPESNLTHLYFKIDDQRQFLDRLRALCITPYATDDVVVTVADPDGRKVMFGTA